MTRTISVVIVSDRSRHSLDGCLASLRAARERVPLEVVVVSDTSGDGTEEWLAEQYPEVERIANPDHRGFAGSVNLGLERARGDYLLLLSSDCVVGPEALEYLMRALQRRPHAGAVGPMMLDADHRIARSCGRFPSLWTLICEHLGAARRFSDSPLFGRYLYGGRHMASLEEVDWASAAALLVSRDAHHKVGGLDDQLDEYMSEVDWCRRAAQSGFSVYYVPQARLVHTFTEPAREAPSESYTDHLRSRIHYFRKHHGRAAAWAAKAILIASLTLKCAASTLRSAERPASKTYAAGLEVVWQA